MFAVVVLLVGITYVFVIRLLRSFKVGNFGDKYVFITGCDTGFGNALAIRLDGLGFHVFAGCLTEEGASSLSKTCSTRLISVPLNVTKSESITAALQIVQQKLPAEKGIWALVNNAGVIGNFCPLELCNKEDFSSVLSINLLGPAETTRQFLPLVRKTRGRIVNITSSFGRFAGFGMPYCASKFGLEALSDILRREVYSQGIKVSIIEPGGFPTTIANKLIDDIIKSLERTSPEVKKIYEANLAKWISPTRKAGGVASSLEPVIDAYTHSIVSRYPRNRYVVGTDARFIFIPMSYLPDWLCDWVMRNVIKM